MAKDPKAPIAPKAPAFSLNALRQALAERFKTSEESDAVAEGLLSVGMSRRALLKHAGTAAVVSALPRLPTPAEALPEIAQAASPVTLAEAADSYLYRFVRHGFQKSHDMLLLSFDITTHPDIVLSDPHLRMPVAQNAQEAIARMEELISFNAENTQHLFAINRFLVAYPDAIQSLAITIRKNTQYTPSMHDDDIVQHLRNQLKHFPNEDAITSRTMELDTGFRLSCNEMLYKRFGVMLPGTTQQEAVQVKETIREEMKNGWGDDVYSPVTVRKFSEDISHSGHRQPTYMMQIHYDKDNTPQENEKEFHALIADIVSRYPSDITLANDTMDLAANAEQGKLLLTPTRAGILITFPAGYEQTQLAQMEEHLAERAMQTRSLSHANARDL